MTPAQFTRGVQSLHRLQRIARVLTKHGFGHVVDRLDLGRMVPIWLRRGSRATHADGKGPANVGIRLRKVANELGPIFVKLGQMLATRPDVVPPDILDELRSLQDSVQPFDSTQAIEIVAQELNGSIDEAFASFEQTAIASGSIGQVHRATLADGRSVVVKIRRPNIENDVRNDLQLLRWLAEALEHWVPETRPYRPLTLIDEFERMLLQELDLMHEAATTSRLREAFRDDSQIIIPEVIWSHTTSRVLTLEAIEGENIEHLLSADSNRINRKELARRLADMYLKQFFEIGTFHCDPHPGNILILPPARVGLIDFGQSGVISDTMAGHLLILLISAVCEDAELLVDTLVEMNACTPETQRILLTRDVQMLLDKYAGQPIRRFRVSTVFSEIANTVRKHSLSLPRDVIAMLKSLATVWGLTVRLDPELDIAALLRTRLTKLVRDRLGPKRLAKTGAVTLWHLLSFMKSAPQQLREVLRQVSSGQWQLNVRHDNLEPLAREMDRAGNRLSFSVVIAAIVVGSSMVVTSGSQMQILGVELQTFGFLGYLVAGFLGIGLLVAILRSGRLS